MNSLNSGCGQLKLLSLDCSVVYSVLCFVCRNYGPTLYVQQVARRHKCQAALWLYERDGEHYITEVGTMNCFILWRNENNGTNRSLLPPTIPLTPSLYFFLLADWFGCSFTSLRNKFSVSDKKSGGVLI